ncbi:hypothetical protein LJC31_05450, partial [Synergistaceae bacterium OttesenSCG-928-I11]|nr:hypothetical protein [Synergistaceae bacterium OttesenSCG-928-I11]
EILEEYGDVTNSNINESLLLYAIENGYHLIENKGRLCMMIDGHIRTLSDFWATRKEFTYTIEDEDGDEKTVKFDPRNYEDETYPVVVQYIDYEKPYGLGLHAVSRLKIMRQKFLYPANVVLSGSASSRVISSSLMLTMRFWGRRFFKPRNGC